MKRRVIVAVLLLVLIPSQVMSGKGYVGMAQTAKEYSSMEEAKAALNFLLILPIGVQH